MDVRSRGDLVDWLGLTDVWLLLLACLLSWVKQLVEVDLTCPRDVGNVFFLCMALGPRDNGRCLCVWAGIVPPDS